MLRSNLKWMLKVLADICLITWYKYAYDYVQSINKSKLIFVLTDDVNGMIIKALK